MSKWCFNYDSGEYEYIKNAVLHNSGRDFAASRGEYLNSLILAKYLKFDFIDAENVIYFRDNGTFDEEKTKSMMNNYSYLNGRPITKSMLVWWAMNMENQEIPSLSTPFEIEHIYARNRNDKENSLSKASNIELLGNKAILEKRINIRASDYRFEDKKKYYLGYTNKRNEKKAGTANKELENFAKDTSRIDFNEQDIMTRTKTILEAFLEYIRQEKLFV